MKKFLLLLSALCVLIGLCACANNSNAYQEETKMVTYNEATQKGPLNDVVETTPSTEDLMRSAVLQYPSQNKEWKYNVYDCYIEITGYIGPNVETLIIPNEIEGLPVWYYNPGTIIATIGDTTLKNTVKSVVVPSNIAIIGSGAFTSFVNLKTIDLSSNLLYIEDGAFLNCQSLEQIALPDTLKKIGDEAFHGCIHLKEVILPASVTEIGRLVFDNTNISNEKTNSDIVIYTGVTLTVCNPDMVFNDGYGIGIIRGYAGSTAAHFAAEYNKIFEIIE